MSTVGPTFRVESLDHVQLAMPAGAEDRAAAFYEGILGIPRVPKPPERVRGGCWFERGALRVHLGVEEDFRPARKAHPALTVSGIAEAVPSSKPPATPPDTSKRCRASRSGTWTTRSATGSRSSSRPG